MSSELEDREAAAWLIDEWGQLHSAAARCKVGRDRALCQLAIADLSVSAEHAELRRDRSGWVVRDRGSANGVNVGDRAQVREARVLHRSRVWFGDVAFYFWAESEPPAREVPPPEVRTLIPDAAAFRITSAGRGELIVRPARGHPLHRAPGELEYREHHAERAIRAALPRLQFQLLRALCEAALTAGNDQYAASVGTQELMARLPFQTPRPRPNHVRQVVSTLRASLARAGVPGGERADAEGVVWASEGLGYRVIWQVRRLDEGAE